MNDVNLPSDRELVLMAVLTVVIIIGVWEFLQWAYTFLPPITIEIGGES